MLTVNNFLKYFAASLYIVSAASLTSCDFAVYEDLEPCELHHKVRFRWDHNMLFADAFQGNVESVAIYAFDSESEVLQWKFNEKGEALAADGYTVNLDELKPGNYKLVAWCGLENDGERSESFTLPYMVVGKSTLDDFYCRLEREIDTTDGSHHSRTDLYDLWHGVADDVTIHDINDSDEINRDYTYTLNLKKDTNRVRIILQQLSGEDVHPYGFTYTIEESNGLLNHDNSLLDDETITYHEYAKNIGYAGLDDPEDYPETGTRAWAIENPISLDPSTRTETSVKVAVADLTMSRLMADRKSTLTIKNSEGTPIVKIPLTDYALLVKDNYSRKMTDQEYLDRQDHYQLTFFLDKTQQWVNASVIINSWRVVLNPNGDFNFDY
jgi:hypothetical protein